ncbi:hypothetical protein CY34DRAFT_813812 [Suillus luteus UH-Slu-Lm8-n1]|uniref:F-box domain-containing protein n=1 Tax=Suillus luteus UH-Slu-Lm8-n1 TaxID=930992 RepID=A0A0D0AG00_9AGAM|nr:hypothetical protein CY34DRAFT_813812 [Suillus luteus UH-Slu-Lm8-n1]
MHRAFKSEDIIYSVLKYLKRKDLKNVAMTCRDLSAPARNILWSKRTSMVSLITCLPQDAWELKDYTINLTREPTPSEWGLFQTNASRVRRLIVLNPDRCMPWQKRRIPKINVSGLLPRLLEQFPPATLFPNLCSFDSRALRESSSDLSLVRKFMSPRLEALIVHVSATVPPYEVEQFIGALAIEGHGLRQLSISMDDGEMAFAVLPNFEYLPKLIELAIHGVDVSLTRQTITNIQQLRCLKTLKLSLLGTCCDGGVVALELSSLESLSLSGVDSGLPQCTRFIRQITTRQLSHVAITYFQRASPIELFAFMESLSGLCQNHGSLKQIRVVDKTPRTLRPYYIDSLPVIPLCSDVFRPLLKFTGLLSVEFVDTGNFLLDDQFIHQITDTWPGIQKLGFESVLPSFINVTFNAMMSLATKCKLLRSLSITCEHSQPILIPQAEDGTERLWPAQTALRALNLEDTPLQEVGNLPYILGNVFPALNPARFESGRYVMIPDPIPSNPPIDVMAEIKRALWEMPDRVDYRVHPDSDDEYSEYSEDEDLYYLDYQYELESDSGSED